jgi:hypothetical protein
MEMPFVIGETYWLPVRTPEQVTIPCPVCAGQLFVTVILGDGSHVTVQCDACGLGHERPRGTITEYRLSPSAIPFVIQDVVSFNAEKYWRVQSADHRECEWADLCPTEAEALAVSEAACRKHDEDTEMSHARARKRSGHATWSIRYANDQIKQAERTIAWHRARISEARTT